MSEYSPVTAARFWAQEARQAHHKSPTDQVKEYADAAQEYANRAADLAQRPNFNPLAPRDPAVIASYAASRASNAAWAEAQGEPIRAQQEIKEARNAIDNTPPNYGIGLIDGAWITETNGTQTKHGTCSGAQDQLFDFLTFEEGLSTEAAFRIAEETAARAWDRFVGLPW